MADWSQRWRDGSHSWRHRSEGGFDSRRYEVSEISEKDAKAFVLQHHYSRSYGAATLRTGLYAAGQLAGVFVCAVPSHPNVVLNVFPDLVPYYESTMLSRFVLLDEVPANGESWFIKHSFRLAAARGIRGVVSFSDPVARVVGGRTLFPGHLGIIYQATNATYTGISAPKTLQLLGDGTVLERRSLTKIPKQKRGYRSTVRKLEAAGAPAYDGSADWLQRALAVVEMDEFPHAGNYRYAHAIGNPTQRAHVRIALPSLPYPKELLVA